MLSQQDAIPSDAFARAFILAQPGAASLLDGEFSFVAISTGLKRALGPSASLLKGGNLRSIATPRVDGLLGSHIAEMMRPGSPILSVSHTDVGALVRGALLRRTWSVLRVDGIRLLLCQDEVIGEGDNPPPLDLRFITLDDVSD
ncbi:hypothetical protein [Azospirillum sp. TSO5]|uniref:hypothetical protein n=1 Tax=Azospirillum sp. TSO5 TaxID=716760 RepID=UPI001FFEFC43|nr:hypothetical protein [Azospirillum sp. TSO5]